MEISNISSVDFGQVIEALELINPSFLLLDSNERIIGLGSSHKDKIVGIKEFDLFSDHFFLESESSTTSKNRVSTNKRLFARDSGENFNVAVVNSSFGVLISSAFDAYSQSKSEVELAKKISLPSENPNPVVIISKKLLLLFANTSAENGFLADFSIDSNGINDDELKTNLLACIENKTMSSNLFLTRGGKSYLLNVVNVSDRDYINIYANDISRFVSQVEEKESELNRLNEENTQQRAFYEYILNNLPSDVAVFSTDHKYLFMNGHAVQNKETREFLIGKDDFDYCRLKGISTDLAEERRQMFQSAIREKVEIEWEDETKDSNGNRKVILRKMSPILDAENQVSYVVGYGIDITAIKLSKEMLQKNNLFQSILMDMATKYINLPIDMVDVTINDSLAQLGDFVQVDRVYIFDYDDKSKTASNSFEWCAEGISPEIESLQFIPYSVIPYWIEMHSEGNEIIVEDTFLLPETEFKKMLLDQDIQSLVALPLMQGKTCIGFVGFDSVKNKRLFYEDEKDLLRMFGKMLVNVAIQTAYSKQINASAKEIQNMNLDLELIVAEKTKRNIELAKSITDQEKLVTIGEIAAGIAHDLNTPLGAIKIGAESLKFTISTLFNDIITKCSEEQINFACKRAMTKQGELYVGGLQLRKEIMLFESYLNETFPELKSESSEIAALLVKSRIGIEETEVIKQLVETKNRKSNLELIYNTQLNRNFIETIMASSERAAKVVQDLRSFIKDSGSSVKGLVNLKENIGTVLTIFNYELKRNIEVQFNVPETLSIVGVDIKLFQLWSNLIKNAIESMNDRDERGHLIISARKRNDTVEVSIQNNGPEIPQNLQKKIFEKFFTTKSNRNGSGLGLSIVNNVLIEHDAKITLSSKPGETIFTTVFLKQK
jgi:signal transduction histidine kinase/PAS domain-containing protein